MSTIIFLFILVTFCCVPSMMTQQYNLNINDKHINKNIKDVYILVAFIAMLFVSCFRTGFVDTATYINIYKNIGINKSLVFSNELDVEIGFKLLCYCLNFITDDPRILIIFVSMSVIIPFYRTIKKYSVNDGLSTMIFLCSIYLYTMNTMRQYIVVGIFIMAYPLLRNKKWIRYTIVVLFASLFHLSAIYVGVILIFCRGDVFNKRIILLIFIFLIVAFLPTQIFLNILSLGVGDYNEVYEIINKGGVNILRLLVQTVPIVLAFISILLGKEKLKNLPKDIAFFVNLNILSLLVYTLALRSNYIARFGLYFDFASIITIPYFLKRIFMSERDSIIAYLMTFSLYAIYFFFAAQAFNESIEMLRPFFMWG